MKTILGLDLGTNSIGWALVEINHQEGTVRIIGLGSRILPMDAGEIKDFENSGKINSKASQRTEKRGARRLNERYLLRRDRFHLVLNLLNSLPEHYKLEIDFKNRNGKKSGKFKKNSEPKLPYLPKKNSKKAQFLFMDSYREMISDIGSEDVKDEKGKRIPYDWTLYYLRQKALTDKISLEELAWVLLSYNQKRGYEKIEVEDKSTKDGEIIEEFDLRVENVTSSIDENGDRYYEVQLEGNDQFKYKEYANTQMTFSGDLKEVIKTSKVDEKGNIDNEKTQFKIVDIYSLEIKNVEHETVNNKHKYTLTYQNGWVEEKTPIAKYTYKYQNALNKPFDYIVETVYDFKGNIKKQRGKERSLREPDLSDNSSDWTLLKKKTEKDALNFNNKHFGEPKKYISPQIYDTLKNDARTGEHTKIIGGMFQVVDRDFYRAELNQIIQTQRKFHNNLNNQKLFEQCVETLYPKNKNHRKALLKNKAAIQHLLVEDILLYQRPLKSKKSEIANCKYEISYWKTLEDKNGVPIKEIDKETGEVKIKQVPIYRKAVSSSHPYFQTFRIWDKLHNLKIIQLEKEVNGKILTNQDVTKEFFKSEDEYQALFDELNNRKSLNQHQFLDFCKKTLKLDYKKGKSNYAWNFPEDDEIKGNETRVSFATRFKRCGFHQFEDFLTLEKEKQLWHYLYSVSYKERSANGNKSAITFFNHFFEGYEIEQEAKTKIIKDFVNYPKFTSRYCAYSEKALKKFIPLIQKGDNKIYHWENESWYTKWKASNDIRKEEILNRIAQIDFEQDKINWDDFTNNQSAIPYPKGLFNTFRHFVEVDEFKHLNLTQASYLVYGRHSELAQAKYWTSPDDIREQLHQELKQHSLNNPIAEKVLLEMMQVVADIWDYYGNGKADFFSKIHVEVGRELKKSAKEKEKDNSRLSENRAQNKRIRQVLEEFLSVHPYNANPRNKDHFERLKIAEDGAEHRKNLDKDFFKDKNYSKKDIDDILKKTSISKADFEKYKLWIEQGYKSPYSGQIIKLTDLFNGHKYNIDHVFPQALITNNSLSNKVVVEVELNKLKSNKTARAFIQEQNGQAYNGIPVCDEDTYVSIVKKQFSGTKRMVLLSKDIPKGFTNSQMNNARHIARKAMELLSHIVREPGEIEFRSKHVLPVTGRITSELKKAWKLNEVWKELVAPRFIRMNELTQSNLFGNKRINKNGKEYFDCNLDPILRAKDDSYDIKRIDHRHHALDALVVALCTEDHVNYINNINAAKKHKEFGKQKQLEKYRTSLKRKIKFTKKDDEKDENNWYYMLPGEIRKAGAENSRRDSVLEMDYFFKNSASFGQDYKKMVLTALQQTIVTFKQNLRVINTTVNKYNNTPNKNKFVKQHTKNGQKKNWAIRRQLSKETVYGKRIVNDEIRRVERELLTEKFNRKKIRKVSDKGVQRILENHLKQFDTVELPFETGIKYLDALFEFAELQAIVNNEETEFNDLPDLIQYLNDNNYKYNKADFKKVNVFIDKVNDRDFRNEKEFIGKIKEHPELAFTPVEIEEMNKPENLKRLNNGKKHMPIRKVQTYQGFGKERAVSEDELSVKSKQFVVTAPGSNLYLGFYELTFIDKNGTHIKERKFEDIDLMELIEKLKQDKRMRKNPLPDKIYDKKKNEYKRIFTLSPLDLVYVPTEEEIKDPSIVDFENLNGEQIDRIYKYVDGSADIANFIPLHAAKPIWRFHGKKNKNIHKELFENDKIFISEKELIQNEFGLGSQQNKNQNMLDGKTQIKKICWKINVDRLGNISRIQK